MKSLLFIILSVMSVQAMSIDYGYLKADDQKYYKNDSLEGNNSVERIDSTVKEINKLYAEVATLKTDMAQLKKEMEELKNKK